jgi:ATP-dependent DNA helicase DinG
MYVYTAANYETGSKTEILSRRKKQLDVGCFEAMAAKISASSVCGDTRLNSDKNPGESVTVNTAEDTARQIFTEILPRHGYAVREKQIELSEHILGVIGKRGVTLAESEVGTGKTHAYLVAPALAKRGGG